MEDIGDPLGDRVMKNVPQIARFPLKKDELWHVSGKKITNQVTINTIKGLHVKPKIEIPIIIVLMIGCVNAC